MPQMCSLLPLKCKQVCQVSGKYATQLHTKDLILVPTCQKKLIFGKGKLVLICKKQTKKQKKNNIIFNVVLGIFKLAQSGGPIICSVHCFFYKNDSCPCGPLLLLLEVPAKLGCECAVCPMVVHHLQRHGSQQSISLCLTCQIATINKCLSIKRNLICTVVNEDFMKISIY